MTTAPPRGALDFSTLSTQFRVMGTSPAWPVVQTAMERLERTRAPGEPYPEYADDVQCVREFAALLAESAENLAAALLCGAAVGRAAGTTSMGERIVLGLSTISDAYRFAEKNADEVGALLGTLRRSLAPLTPSAAAVAGKMPTLYDTPPETWLSLLGERLNAVGAPLGTEDFEPVVRKAWDSALGRVNLYFRGHPRRPPDPEELLTAAARLGPGALLRFDLDAMTLSDWSNALSASLQWDAPPWLAPASLAALRFSFPDREKLAAWLGVAAVLGPHADAKDVLTHAAQWNSNPLARAALIVRREKDSLVAPWQPSPSVAAVALTARELRALAERWSPGTPGPPVEPGVQLLAFEMPMDEPGIDDLVIGTLREKVKVEHEIPVAYLYSRRPKEKTRGPVLTPKRLEDLFADAPPPP